MIMIGYHSDQMRFDRGRPKTFTRARGVIRSFCAKCGIGYVDAGLSGEVYICTGFVDAPERFPLEVHGYWRMRLPFIKMDDGLARTDAYTRGQDPKLGLPRERE